MTSPHWRLLIVDNNPHERAEIRRMLLRGSERRYHFSEAETGRAALEIINTPGTPPLDCIILDFSLPDMDAVEIIGEVCRYANATPSCPVVVLIGGAEQELGQQVLRAGAQDYLGKGWMTAESLTRAIENAVERWALTREVRERENLLRIADSTLRLQRNRMPIGCIALNLDFTISDWNPSCERIFGFLKEEVLGHSLFGICIPVEQEEGVKEDFKKLESGHPEIHRLSDNITKAGHRILCEWHNATIFDTEGKTIGFIAMVQDVTEREQTTKFLREREEQLVLALRAADLMLFVWDVQADIVERRLGHLAALPPTDSDSPGPTTFQEMINVVHPEDRKEFRATIDKCLQGDGAYSNTYRIIEPDNSICWIEEHGKAYFDDLGRPLKLLGFAADVTKRIMQEEELRRAQLLTQSIIDGSPTLVFAKNLKGEYVIANQAWLNFVGLKGDEWRGKSDKEIFDPDTSEVFEQNDRRAIETGAAFATEESVTAQGRSRTFLSNKFLLRDIEGQVFAVCSVSVDITDLKEAKAEIADRELRYRLVADAANDAVWDWDLSTGQVLWNEGVKTRFGYTTEQIRPDASWWTNNISADDRERVVFRIYVQLEQGPDEWRDEYRFRRADGGYASVFDRGKIVRDGKGKAVRMVGSMLDLTLLKAAEEALKDADRRKDEFLATLAHELRNPLAPLRTGLQVLRLNPTGSTADAAREMMERQLGHMVHLVDDLLDVSRISRGKVELKRERLSLKTIIESAIETSRPSIDEAHHTLTLKLPSEPVYIDGDLTRLAQAVSNILTNAAKYTPQGGRIELVAKQEATRAVISITDNGVGIPSELTTSVFEMFAQVNRNLNRSQGGLGIGLALVKRLIEMHGGTIEAQSPGAGKGSTFTIRLPIALPEEASLEESSPVTLHHAPEKRRILIVDDNKDGADSLAMLLSMLGYEATTAHNGYEALDSVHAHPPDLIFLDIGLPGIDGYEVARRLRSDIPVYNGTIVALTGWGSDKDKQKSRESGCDAHLTKPVDLGAVEQILTRLSPVA